ncbi:11168_t:CDS:2 [Funneliformis mosseae]|uniref:11168_t:CDS:1 n=1 Tax=Funneliformis mosseae TaxID=27381 RepID=A0A9N9AXL4_FUNMO|nr:11168_t:CDS:2 [Funneliformis mosseae]
MTNSSEIRVVAAIDFGTTYSGFAYAHKKNPNDIFAHDIWKSVSGYYKTPTVLKYDESFNLLSWGLPALAERPSRRNRQSNQKPVERFKLHLGKMENKPPLPSGINHKTAITDYLREIGKVMKETFDTRWSIKDFFNQVLIVMTVPAEFGQEAMKVMRECAFKADLINQRNSGKLKFTTEPEAAAIYCMNKLTEHNLGVGSSFMIVDCGGGTVDLTTRKLLKDNKLDEITEREGDFCGGSFVDEEFLKFIGRKVGSSALSMVRTNHYSQLQYMVQEFCRRIKIQFTGKESDFQPYDMDLKELCPVIKQYSKGVEFENMEEEEWTVELTFDDVKSMFDPVIGKIIRLIRGQLEKCSDVALILLVGGFSESKYLQERIKNEFKQRLLDKIIVPANPMVAIEKGAVQFGLSQGIVNSRILKWTYGTDVIRQWALLDPIDRRRADGKIRIFDRLARRGEKVDINHQVARVYVPYSNEQTSIGLDLYVTEDVDANYCDETGVYLLDNWSVNVPTTYNNEGRSIAFTLTFGSIEIEATAQNVQTGVKYETTFNLDL